MKLMPDSTLAAEAKTNLKGIEEISLASSNTDNQNNNVFVRKITTLRVCPCRLIEYINGHEFREGCA